MAMPQKPFRILKNQTKWEDLYFYQKSEVLYQMTVVFCRRQGQAEEIAALKAENVRLKAEIARLKTQLGI